MIYQSTLGNVIILCFMMRSIKSNCVLNQRFKFFMALDLIQAVGIFKSVYSDEHSQQLFFNHIVPFHNNRLTRLSDVFLLYALKKRSDRSRYFPDSKWSADEKNVNFFDRMLVLVVNEDISLRDSLIFFARIEVVFALATPRVKDFSPINDIVAQWICLRALCRRIGC